MAGHQKNTKFNKLAAYNQQNRSKYSTSQKYCKTSEICQVR